MKKLIILGIFALFALYSCQDSGVIEKNKITTPLENEGWEDHSMKVNYDSLDVFDVCFHNSAIIAGTSHNILLGLNRGTTWKEVPLTPGINENVLKLQTLNSGKVFAMARNRLYQSMDGGETWNIIFNNTATQINQFANFRFTDDNKGFVFGSDKKIYMTTNTGSTWTELADAEEYPGDMTYDGTGKIYILNWNNKVSIFDVNTLTFSSEIISNNAIEQAFKITSCKGNVWASALHQIYFRKAGENSWNMISNSEDFSQYGASFKNESIGYGNFFRDEPEQNNVIRRKWYVKKTIDGGKTWTTDFKVDNSKNGSLTCIFAEKENKIVAAGATYIISKPKL